MKYLLAILPIFIMLTLAPALLAVSSNVYAQNEAVQSISQIQGAVQLGICLSGIDTFISCNNLNLQNQFNSGGNTAGQIGGSGKGSGNSAEQGIGQSQYSNQRSQCVSGEDAIVSCNNAAFQEQVNSGNTIVAQMGLVDEGDSAEQGIAQAETTENEESENSDIDFGIQELVQSLSDSSTDTGESDTDSDSGTEESLQTGISSENSDESTDEGTDESTDEE
jgi:hypothetical protein